VSSYELAMHKHYGLLYICLSSRVVKIAFMSMGDSIVEASVALSYGSRHCDSDSIVERLDAVTSLHIVCLHR
jgi:hypothetical protein